MSKHIYFHSGIMLLLALALAVPINAVIVSHTPAEVTPGTFAVGDYSFSGSIGIGTNNPSSKLDIMATGNGAELLRFSTERPWIFRQNGTGANSQLELHSNIDGKDFIITSSDNSSVAEFFASTVNPAIYLLPNGGNVGIGTSSASYKLDVSGTGRFTGALASSTIDTGSGAMELGDAAITDGDTDSIPTNDQVYDFVSSNANPPGTVLTFAGINCPIGYLNTDGSAVSRATYSSLFSVIGTLYGIGDGSTTFNLPDYRGYFLRGTDDGAGNDPDAASRTDSGGGTTGDNVGTKQDYEVSSHLHSVDPPSTSSDTQGAHTHSVDPPSTASGGQSANHVHSVNPPSTQSNSNGAHTHTVSGKDGSDYINYIISFSGRADWTTRATNTGSAGAHTHWTDIAAFNSGSNSASHTHTTNIAAFTSGSAGGHSHTTDIASFNSGNTGGNEVRPKNINVLYCIKH